MNDTTLSLREWRHAARDDRQVPAIPTRPEKLVYLLRHDMLYATDVALQLFAYGYDARIADDLPQLIAMTKARMPGCIVIDAEEGGVALSLADTERLRAAADDPLPILLVSARNHFDARLAAARAGVDGYFTKPLDFCVLAERLDAVTTSAGMRHKRVLVVCSEAERSAFYEGILAGAGIEALQPPRPSGMLHMLDQFRPDAVLMDIDMPGCTATDLTALMRQDTAFADIPAIILSDAQDPSFRKNAIRSGADEIIAKPVTPDNLVFALTNRIERYRNLSGLIMLDRLTNLYNHTAFKEQLRREMGRARREKKPLAFAMLDLDFFKKVNDRYGHPVGDQVLRSIARLMRQRLRNGDVVGRYGGEEFGIILPGTTAAAAADVLNEIRIEFQNIHHRGRDTEFCATFTAGVAEFGEGMEGLDSISLIRIADRALYQGKRAGRNRVELAER
jgi:diguanylate cyclase (GGDEF)-like protein